jgi:hypothetical protein
MPKLCLALLALLLVAGCAAGGTTVKVSGMTSAEMRASPR